MGEAVKPPTETWNEYEKTPAVEPDPAPTEGDDIRLPTADDVTFNKTPPTEEN